MKGNKKPGKINHLLVLGLSIVLFIFIFCLNLKANFPIQYSLSADSGGYIMTARQFQGSSYWHFDMSRSPVYPLFLAILSLDLYRAVFIQILLNSLTPFIIYFICQEVFHYKKILSLFIAMVITFDYRLVIIQNTILAEGILVPIFLFSLYMHLRALNVKNWTWLFLVLLVASDCLMGFIKPVFILLPMILYAVSLFLILRQKKKITNLVILLGTCLLINISCVFTFQIFSIATTKNNLVSDMMHINLLGKLIQYDFIRKSYDSEPEILSLLRKKYMSSGLVKNPYKLTDNFTMFQNNDELNKVNFFLLKHNYAPFVVKSILLLPTVTTVNALTKHNNDYGKTAIHMPSLYQTVTGVLGVPYVRLAGLFIYMMVLAINRGRKEVSFGKAILLLVGVVYFLILNSFFGYVEYSRLRLPIEPLLDIITLSAVYYMIVVTVRVLRPLTVHYLQPMLPSSRKR